MKQVIPFYKEIVFKNNIANIVSVSLEHNEKIMDGEVVGEFIIFGEYKIHNDTTEKESFKYKLPFTALIPDDVDTSTITVDIADFKYEQIDVDVLRIDIDFTIEGECLELERGSEIVIDTIEEDIDKEIEEILNIEEDVCEEEIPVLDIVEDVEIIEEPVNKIEEVEDVRNEEIDQVVEEVIIEEKHEEKKETMEEYVTYHVHVVGNSDSLEGIMKLYNTNMDLLNNYNDIKELKVGDKLIIPEYLDE